MTIHDSERWLEAAIRSITGQTWTNLQIVLVDDASTDSSVEIIRAAQAIDGRIELIRMSANAGTYAAKNAGLAQARGDAITFMDSDDTCNPQRIEKQLAALRAPGIVASTCNYVRHTEGGELVLNQGLRERLALISLMIKREIVDEIGWFDNVRTSADYEYFQRLRAVYGRQAHANVDEPLYLALYREQSLTTDASRGTDLRNNEAALLSEPRKRYVDAFSAWHSDVLRRGRRPYMPRHSMNRPFVAPAELLG
jgi:glycosyltransferase involved in cell wall biosynthesis